MNARSRQSRQNPELSARPTVPTRAAPGPGTHQVRLGDGQNALVHTPAKRSDAAAPLVVLLHGAGATPVQGLHPLLPLADDAGLLLLAPASRESTWDVLVGGFGPDVDTIDAGLAWVFDRFHVDAGRIALAGFSDGASYALSLGLGNGDAFGHLIAFSPGFNASRRRQGRPRVFVSHGVDDPVLPIERCSRPIVAHLRDDGYDVTYREFDDGHVVPPSVSADALAWFESA